MRIDHLAIWTEDIEKMKDFYINYFEMDSSEKYINEKKQFSSYFLSFKEGSRLELMNHPDICRYKKNEENKIGLAHFSISVGSRINVNNLTERLRSDGYVIKGEPRLTGDGYYESVILDPEGNTVEISE